MFGGKPRTSKKIVNKGIRENDRGRTLSYVYFSSGLEEVNQNNSPLQLWS